MDTRRIRFASPNQNLFFQTLHQRVDAYFRENGISKNANLEMKLKTVILLTLYIGPFIFLLTGLPSFGPALLLWAIMGFAMAGVGMSVMHDANHGAYSSDTAVNNLLGHSLNLVGGSIANWKNQHNLLHHTYTNITDADEDIDDKGILRFSPHTPYKSFTKAQWIYAFFIYGITTLYWVSWKDFAQYLRYVRKGLVPDNKKVIRSTLVKMAVGKTIYFLIVIGLPIFLGGYSFLQVLAGFFLMHFLAGFTLTVIFQLAHSVEGAEHPMPNAQGEIENEWAVHQMHTTVNFAPNNRFLNWYIGGLNHQVEHHLFPKICHVHYPKIAPIVKQTAQEFGVPYLENDTFIDALRSHIRLLRDYGKMPSLDEAIG